MSSVSLPILRNIESNPITEVKDRMISDSSFARQQKLQMIVEQTELLLSAESKLVDSVNPEVCYLGKKYELNRRESLMLLPDIKLTDQTKKSMPRMMIEKLDKSIDTYSKNQKVSHELIDIIENPELSRTSFYIPPYTVNDALLDKPNDKYYSFDSSTKRRRRVHLNDTNVLLKIHGELSPLRCELSEIAAKFRALRLQRIYGSIEESKNVSSGSYAFNPMDIDRSLLKENSIVGNLNTQFSPMTMVGKSMSRESFNHISTGNFKFFVQTGLHEDRSYCEPRQPMYFDITSGNNDSTIGKEYRDERIANYYTQTNTPFERYHRPRSSCIHDRYQSDKGNVVRSMDYGHSYYKNFISRKSYDINGSQYISRENADQPTDLFILDRSKEVVREDHRIPCDRRDGKRNLRSSSTMGMDIVKPKFIVENSLSIDKESSSKISLCKSNRYSSLDVVNTYPKKKRSTSSTVKNIEMFVNENTSKDYLIPRESRLDLKHRHHKRQSDTVIVNRSSQTSKQTIDFKDISNVSSSTSSRKIKVINLPNNIEKVKIIPVFFTTGIPKPLFPLIELDEDPVYSINRRDKSMRCALTLKEKDSLKISNNRKSEIRDPSESDVSCSYITSPLTLDRDYFSENERWNSGNNPSSKITVSSYSRRSSSTKKTTSANALKYSNALGSICSGVARVTVSGTTMSNQQKRFKQIREITHEKGIRGMRSSPEDFLCDT
ncbi:uncharacterized protein LOC124424363 [Vespa crabro]|uniref:uncharacterized protein LOC124424363 n=1 Tax=Vespa crabro TaxID=7445 RepID=UPI001F00625A|nr:uncharacterized protein LOC124424363 [Vespa crabro]